MDLLEQSNKVMAAVRSKYTSRSEMALSVEVTLTRHEYGLVAARLLTEYQSIQTSYNQANGDKVLVIIGIV